MKTSEFLAITEESRPACESPGFFSRVRLKRNVKVRRRRATNRFEQTWLRFQRVDFAGQFAAGARFPFFESCKSGCTLRLLVLPNVSIAG